MKLLLIEALVEEGRDMRPEPDLEAEEELVDFVRMEGRFLGIVGACARKLKISIVTAGHSTMSALVIGVV